jgi:hypothetical protein
MYGIDARVGVKAWLLSMYAIVSKREGVVKVIKERKDSALT